jgi:hypothetical protein
MAQKQIEIIINVENKEVDIATKRTLTLTQQIKILKQELAKGSLGQKEFELVAAKVGDLEDQMAKARRRSADFATTLQLIPGPIGEIASKVNGVIALLKQFSGFSFKDLQFQFKETANDLKEIILNLGSWGFKVKETDDIQKKSNKTLEETAAVNASAGQSIIQNVKIQQEAAQASLKANQEQIASLKQKVQQETDYKLALESEIQKNQDVIKSTKASTAEKNEARKTIKNYTAELGENQRYLKRYQESLNTLTKAQTVNTTTTQQDANAQNQLAGASQNATVSTTEQTVATGALNTVMKATYTSAQILRGVLVSLGIGLIIALITTAASKFMDWVKEIRSTEKESQKLDETLRQLNRTIESNLQLLDEEIEIQKIRAQVAGKTEKEINDITITGIDKRIASYQEGQKKLSLALAKLQSSGLTPEQIKEKGDTIEKQYLELDKKILESQSQRRIQEVRGEQAVANDRKKITKKSGDDQKQIRDQELLQIVNGRKEAFMSLLTDAQKEEYIINEKYVKLERLAVKYGQDTKDLEEARLKELADLRKKYDKENLDDNLKRINAVIEQEQNATKVDIDALKILLKQKRDLELQNTQLTNEERFAIVSRYNKQFRDLDSKEREDKLIQDIASTRGNFDEQIRLYQEFQNEVVNSTQYNGDEQLKVINDTNEKIRQLQDERFQDSLNKLELEYGAAITYDSDYFDKLRQLYDTEKQRYKDLKDTNQITDAEYTAFLKQNAQTRIQIDQEELNAKMANFQAVSQLFAASAALIGEQTKAGKALSIASATIDTYVAANQALSEKGPPTFLKVITAAGIIIRGLTNVKKIVEVPLPTMGGGTTTSDTSTKPMGTINVNAQKKAQGGLVTGPGTETSDSIPAFLSNGEYVINARSTRMFQPILSAINGYGQNTPSFAAGGLVMGSQTSQQTQNSQSLTDVIQQEIRREPIRTYVTSQDVTNQQQFDRIIKSRSLI